MFKGGSKYIYIDPMRTNERPGNDHVTSGPMRGLNAPGGAHIHTHGHGDSMTEQSGKLVFGGNSFLMKKFFFVK